jgi:hypothetical protein
MTQPTQVFISHSTRDEGTARAVARVLSKVGVEVWTPAEMSAGEEIADTLWRKLREADIVVLLVTQGFVDSPSILSELGASLALNKRIVSVVVGDIADDEIPFRLRSVPVLRVSSKADVPRKVAEFLVSAAAA